MANESSCVCGVRYGALLRGYVAGICGGIRPARWQPWYHRWGKIFVPLMYPRMGHWGTPAYASNIPLDFMAG
jgi:hypothetical protein